MRADKLARKARRAERREAEFQEWDARTDAAALEEELRREHSRLARQLWLRRAQRGR